MPHYEYGFLTKMAESGASEDDIAKVYALLVRPQARRFHKEPGVRELL